MSARLRIAVAANLCAALAAVTTSLPSASAAATRGSPASGPPPTVLYAAPNGTATEGCSISAPCSLFGAQAVVRGLTPAMKSDIVVMLRGGTYRLSRTWTFSAAAGDSGTGGHRVVYEAYPGETPLISGAQRLTGWTLQDPAKNIWSAPAPGLQTRELYVDGVRAQIDHGPINPGGWGTPTATGLVAPDASMASWPDIVGTEVVSENQWEHRSCPITAASGQDLTLAQPCYHNTQLPYDFQSGAVIGQSSFNVSWVQNAYELLGTPGEFYLDTAHGKMYYVPRPGENLATADVEAPVLQTLVEGAGTATSPLQDITFSGLTFAYATWLAPASSSGYAEAQAGWHITGDNLTSVPMQNLTPTPGEITFNHDTGLEFSDDTFTHLGSVGLDLAQGSKNTLIVGNKFTDIGSSALQIGSVDTADRHPPTADQVSGVTVRNNAITFAGQVYRSAVGVFVGYTLNTTITHNAIGNLPYTAISVNLGWEGTSYSGGAVITYNEIFQDMGVLSDGGALYTQMPMTTPSVMKYNWLHDESNIPGGTPLYLDSTAGNWTAEYNVLQGGGAASRNIQNCCGVPAQHNTVEFNFSNASGALHGQPDPTNTVRDNWDNLQVMPPEAQTIMAQAGLQPQYAYLLSQRTYNDTTSTISYTGLGWNYSSNRGYGDFGDDVHYSYQAGATVTIPFNGSGIAWLAQRSNQTGPVEVYIDGADQGEITPVTSGGPPFPTQQIDYSISGLPAGYHTLRISSQSSQLITVDAFTVSASRPTTDDAASAVTYAGPGWTLVKGAGNYDGTLHTTSAAGASASFQFTGTGASWVAPRDPASGSVQVYVDGLDQGTVTPNAAIGPFPAQQVDYSVTGLLPGTHTLKIVNRSAAVLSVDAFTVETSRTAIGSASSAVTYSGSGWVRAPASQGGCGSDVYCTSGNGDSVTVIATGSGISWVAPQRADTGPVRVYVDGVDEGVVTPVTGTTDSGAEQVNYSVTGLVPGVHRLQVVNLSAQRLAVGAFTALG